MARVKALPPDYQIVYKEIQRYLFKVGPVDLPDGSLLTGIVDFFEQGVVDGKGVLELIGNDVAAFCDDLVKDSRTHADIYQESISGEPGTAGLAVPPVLQLDDPAAGGGAGDQVELVGLGNAVEQPGALARNVGEQAQLELVDQVEPHERPPEADAAPDHDVAVAASPELVDLFCRVSSGDGGVGPVGRLQGPGEDDLARGVQDGGERVVGGRCHGLGDALVGGAAHDVRVRALDEVELRRFVGLTVFGQGEAELPKLGALVGEKAVEGIVEHCRYQLPHDQNSMVSARLGTVLAGERACSGPQRSRGRGVWPT